MAAEEVILPTVIPEEVLKKMRGMDVPAFTHISAQRL